MFPMFLLVFFSAFLMTAIVVKSSNSRLRPTHVTSDDIRRLSIHYNMIQLYNEFNELLNKVYLCEKVNNQEVKEMRRQVFRQLAGDIEDLNFKMQDVFRVMNTQMDLRYLSFDNYMLRVEYEEDLAKETSSLIGETEEMIAM